MYQKFLDLIGHRVTNGSEHGWACFGPDAYIIDHDSRTTGRGVSCTFDTETKTVFELSAYDEHREYWYRWINPEYVQAYEDEAKKRGVRAKQAYDDVDYIMLGETTDYFEKAAAILAGEDFDERILISVDIPEWVEIALLRLAAEQDITFNKLMNNILVDSCNRVLNNPEFKDKIAQELVNNPTSIDVKWWNNDDWYFAETESELITKRHFRYKSMHDLKLAVEQCISMNLDDENYSQLGVDYVINYIPLEEYYDSNHRTTV